MFMLKSEDFIYVEKPPLSYFKNMISNTDDQFVLILASNFFFRMFSLPKLFEYTSTFFFQDNNLKLKKDK